MISMALSVDIKAVPEPVCWFAAPMLLALWIPLVGEIMFSYWNRSKVKLYQVTRQQLHNRGKKIT